MDLHAHMDTDALLLLGCKLLGLSGLALLGISATGGVVLASNWRRRSTRVLGAATRPWHRRGAILGTTLLLLHPLPALAVDRTRLDVVSATVPFAVPEQRVAVAAGIAGLWVLVVVAGSSSRAARRRLGRRWRTVHYATYAALALGVAHAVLMVGGYPANPSVDVLTTEKLAIGTPVALFGLLVVARVAGACLNIDRRRATAAPIRSNTGRLGVMLEESARQRWQRQRDARLRAVEAGRAGLRHESGRRAPESQRQWQGYEPESVKLPVPAAGRKSQE
jgi:DMSO/TMAO reductase YedYZ heme-binding membrane subunit